jgi:hypothetical protein
MPEQEDSKYILKSDLKSEVAKNIITIVGVIGAIAGGVLTFYTQIIEPRHWPPSPVIECKIDTLENNPSFLIVKGCYCLKNSGTRPFRVIDGWATIVTFSLSDSSKDSVTFKKTLETKLEYGGDSAIFHYGKYYSTANASSHIVDYYRPIHDEDVAPQQNLSFQFICRINKDTNTKKIRALLMVANAIVRDEAHKDHSYAGSIDADDGGTDEFVTEIKKDTVIKNDVTDPEYMRSHHLVFARNTHEIMYH